MSTRLHGLPHELYSDYLDLEDLANTLSVIGYKPTLQELDTLAYKYKLPYTMTLDHLVALSKLTEIQLMHYCIMLDDVETTERIGFNMRDIDFIDELSRIIRANGGRCCTNTLHKVVSSTTKCGLFLESGVITKDYDVVLKALNDDTYGSFDLRFLTPNIPEDIKHLLTERMIVTIKRTHDYKYAVAYHGADHVLDYYQVKDLQKYVDLDLLIASSARHLADMVHYANEDQAIDIALKDVEQLVCAIEDYRGNKCSIITRLLDLGLLTMTTKNAIDLLYPDTELCIIKTVEDVVDFALAIDNMSYTITILLLGRLAYDVREYGIIGDVDRYVEVVNRLADHLGQLSNTRVFDPDAHEAYDNLDYIRRELGNVMCRATHTYLK